MIKFIGENNKYTAIVRNEKEFLDSLEEKLNLLIGDNYLDKYTVVYKTRLFDTILENRILEEFIKHMHKVEKNKPYLINFSLKDENYSFIIANVSIDEENQGFIINKTLQVLS